MNKNRASATRMHHSVSYTVKNEKYFLIYEKVLQSRTKLYNNFFQVIQDSKKRFFIFINLVKVYIFEI